MDAVVACRERLHQALSLTCSAVDCGAGSLNAMHACLKDAPAFLTGVRARYAALCTDEGVDPLDIAAFEYVLREVLHDHQPTRHTHECICEPNAHSVRVMRPVSTRSSAALRLNSGISISYICAGNTSRVWSVGPTHLAIKPSEMFSAGLRACDGCESDVVFEDVTHDAWKQIVTSSVQCDVEASDLLACSRVVRATVYALFVAGTPLMNELYVAKSPDGSIETCTVCASDASSHPRFTESMGLDGHDTRTYMFCATRGDRWLHDGNSTPSYMFFLTYVRFRLITASVPSFAAYLQLHANDATRRKLYDQCRVHMLCAQRSIAQDASVRLFEQFDQRPEQASREGRIDDALSKLDTPDLYYRGYSDPSIVTLLNQELAANQFLRSHEHAQLVQQGLDHFAARVLTRQLTRQLTRVLSSKPDSFT